VHRVTETLAAEFGAFLIVEVWAGPSGDRASDPAVPSKPPVFQVAAPPSAALAKTLDMLARRLRRIKVLKQAVKVEVLDEGSCEPPGMPPLVTSEEAVRLNCWSIGLVVPPVYRDAKTGREFPILMRQLRRSLSLALKQTFFQFARTETTHRPPHYHELGRRAVVKAVWEIDRQLGEVSNAFDFLLQLTPVNSDDAWSAFKRSGYERVPELHYRPTPFDPALLKRQLYQIPIERVEDPALQHLFQEKQYELDRKITMIAERDTPRFVYGSLQLYGGVEDDLHQLASDLLQRLPRRSNHDVAKVQLNAEAFADRARAEFEHYRELYPGFSPKAQVTRKVVGVMVSRGSLLINHSMRVPISRVAALLQHEVGTHLLAYYNGRAQPFRQLYSGLAGYEAFQEGLAVLAEYLAGGLDRPRMRQLAGRVIAVRQMLDGAPFVDTYRKLERDYAFPRQSAFRTTMRIYRGGGLTKDAVYLRGLREILAFLSRGGELATLFVGKIGADHVPIVKGLRFRKVLEEPPLHPRYMDDAAAMERLAALRNGNINVLDLIE
jgi:uncharacterized protein (TIGR02421 family)